MRDIDTYITGYPKNVQSLLQKMRATIKKAAPRAQEAISYGIPTYKFNGNLVHFGAFKDHISFFPTSSGIAAFKKEILKYKIAKGTIQFPLDKPLPLSLVRKIVAFRVKENTQKDWKTCSRGHTYRGSGPCLVCWPGGAKKKYTQFHKDGSIWAKGFILRGKMEGAWVWFRNDGSKMRSGSFTKGKQTGKWTTYDKTGGVVKVTDFRK